MGIRLSRPNTSATPQPSLKQLRQVLREKKMREGEGYSIDETLLASQILAFCEGMLSRFVRSEFKYRPTDDFDARWPLVAAQRQ